MTNCLLRFIDLSIYQSIPILYYSGYWDSGRLGKGKKKPCRGGAIKGEKIKGERGEGESCQFRTDVSCKGSEVNIFFFCHIIALQRIGHISFRRFIQINCSLRFLIKVTSQSHCHLKVKSINRTL